MEMAASARASFSTVRLEAKTASPSLPACPGGVHLLEVRDCSKRLSIIRFLDEGLWLCVFASDRQ